MNKIFTNTGIVALIVSITAILAWYEYHSNADVGSIGSQLSYCITKDASALGVTIDETCLHPIVADLLSHYSTGDVFAALEASSSPEILVQHCHAVGHVIGEETYSRARSVEDALTQCTESCRYACTHGVVGEAVAKEIGINGEGDDIAHADVYTIQKLGKKYCATPSMCHAMGHILFTKFQEYNDSLATCDAIATHGEREYCYQGVFMESVGGDQSLLFSKNNTEPPDDYGYPCNRVDAKYAHACFRYLTSFQKQLFDAHGINSTEDRLHAEVVACNAFSGTTHQYCIEGLAFNNWRYFMANTDIAQRFCDAFTGDKEKSCVLGIVVAMSDFFYRDDAVKFCSGIEEEGQQTCFNAAFQIIEEKLSLPEMEDVCAKSENTSRCMTALDAYGVVRNYLPVYEFGLYGEPL